ncbi:MAG: PHP domain-containing protein [Anaerosomatales bacterium]|nr:PHP domain-containing protein [Anaerosomatales bacterium]
MPHVTLDLHNHTPLIPNDYRGDAATSPRAIVERALECGIDVLGVTDHFSVLWVPMMLAAAEEVAAESGRRLLVIPGSEIKVRHASEETHLVALFSPATYVRGFAALMDGFGLPRMPAPIEELPALFVREDQLEVAALIDSVGGVCIVGHVDRTFGDYRFIDSALAHELVESPAVHAIELIDHSSRCRFRDGLAIAHVCSSDSHSLAEMGRRTSTIELDELSFEGLKRAFARHRASPAEHAGIAAV